MVSKKNKVDPRDVENKILEEAMKSAEKYGGTTVWSESLADRLEVYLKKIKK